MAFCVEDVVAVENPARATLTSADWPNFIITDVIR